MSYKAEQALRDCVLFDADWYSARYGMVRRSGLDPLAHFVAFGADLGLRPCPLFDTAWYVAAHPQVRTGFNPLLHFVQYGWRNGLRPNRLFDSEWYIETYRDARPSWLDPLSHFLLDGWRCGCRPNILFDTAFYVTNYPLSTAWDRTPLEHFIEIGSEEGAWPNPFFDTAWYLEHYVDARMSSLDPLSHYREQGAIRNYKPNRMFDPVWYRATYLSSLAPDTDALAHFIAVGASHNTRPNALLDFVLLSDGGQNHIESRAELHACYLHDHRNVCAPSAGARKTRSDDGPKVLFLDALYPRPDMDSGSIDTLNYLVCLRSLGFAVTFVSTAAFFTDDAYRAALEALGVDCVDYHKFSSVEEFISRCGGQFAVFFLTRVYSGGHFFELAKSVAPGAAFVFNTVDLHHIREERETLIGKLQDKVEVARWTRGRELYLTRQCDATIVVSSNEAKLLQQGDPNAKVVLIPLLREIPGRTAGFDERDRIGFIGNFGHRPNVDAVEYFLDEIWPKLLVKRHDLRFEVVGTDLPKQLLDRRDRNVTYAGHVLNLGTTLARWRVSVAPLRFGAGAKGKIVSSLAYGVPCVATPLAVEGMDLEADLEIAVAADPRAFSDAVSALLVDATRWLAASEAGLEAVRRTNDIAQITVLLTDLLERIGIEIAEPALPGKEG